MTTTEESQSRRTKPAPRPPAPSYTKKSASLPQETVEYLKSWMMSPEHIAHPYPTEQEKAQIMAETGIELKQLTNWFVNNRKRYWKPRVEAKLTVEDKVVPPPAEAAFPPPPPLPSVQPRVQRSPLPMNEDPHTVSEGGSVVSSSSATPSGWCSEEDDSFDAVNPSFLKLAQPQNVSVHRMGLMAQYHSKEGALRREVVDVHVLHPEAAALDSDEEILPTLRDVTIKSNVKKEMVLATFPKCLLQYSVPEEIENDRKKIQTRRDGEVLRVKKHYLKLYLATRGIHSVPSPYGENPMDVIANASNSSSNSSVNSASNLAPEEETHAYDTPKPDLMRKRPIACNDIEEPVHSPRKRRNYATKNGEEEWRKICQNAKDIFCETLPGLEEAAVMFGYATQ